MTQEFVTLPREVVEQAIEALFCTDSEEVSTAYESELEAVKKLRAALEQPKNHIEQHLGMVPAGWKLVPVEPNCSMVLAGERSLEQHDFLRLDSAYRAMLDAAPQPPVLDQPQAEQPAMTPIAQRKLDSLLTEGYAISGYSVYHERKHQHGFVTGAGLVGWRKPEGVEYPQPRSEQEPDWSDSKTLPSELWKNPLLSLQERLQIADGAVQWNREVAENLRARLCAAQQPQGEQDTKSYKVTGKTGEFCVFHSTEVKRGDMVYTHPQPKREPLTDEQVKVGLIQSIECTDVRERCAFNIGVRFAERAHNIK